MTGQVSGKTYFGQTMGDKRGIVPQPPPQSFELSGIIPVLLHMAPHCAYDAVKSVAFHQPVCRHFTLLTG